MMGTRGFICSRTRVFGLTWLRWAHSTFELISYQQQTNLIRGGMIRGTQTDDTVDTEGVRKGPVGRDGLDDVCWVGEA